MAYPDRIKGTYINVLIGNGANPEVFVPLCGLNARTLNAQLNGNDEFLKDCADPEDTPVRAFLPTGRQWDISGSGVVDRNALQLIIASQGYTKNYRFVIGKPNGASGYSGYWTGPAVLTNLTFGGNDDAFATIELTIVSDGLWEFVELSGGGGTPTPTPTPAPAFTSQPSISPSNGTAGSTVFTANDGVSTNTTGKTRRWLLGTTAIGTGTTVTPNAAGSLTLEVTATGPGGSTTATSAAVTVAAATPTPTPTPGTYQRAAMVGPMAGGYVTGIQQTADGSTLVTSTDVGNGYVSSASDDDWKFVVSYATIPALDSYPDFNPPKSSDGNGTYAVAIAPSNPQIGYFAFRGRFWRSTDKFATATPTANFSARGYNNGGEQRRWNHKLVVDPRDPLTLLFGSEGDGAFWSTDGGVTMTKVVGPADVTFGGAEPYPINVAFQANSAATGGRTSRAVMFVPGDGFWQTTTGVNGTWSKMTGTPTEIVNRVSQLFFDASGTMWVVARDQGGQLWRRTTAGVWTMVEDFPGICYAAVLANGQKVAVDDDGNLRWTPAAAVDTWPGDTFRPTYPNPQGMPYVGTKVKWLTKGVPHLFPGGMIADTQVANKVWLVHGTGICSFILPTSDIYNGSGPAPTVQLNDFSYGNRMLVTLKTHFMPNGWLLRGSWDKGPWIDKTTAEQRNPTKPARDLGVEHVWDTGWLPNEQTTIWAHCYHENWHSGISYDGGATWQEFAVPPDGPQRGGCMQFISRTRGFFLPSNNGRAIQTSDAGATWQPLVFTTAGGVSSASTYDGQETGWSFAAYFNKQNLWASREEPGVVYAYNYGPDVKPQLRGLWRKEANSDTFTQVYVGSPTGPNAQLYYYMAIREVPGHAGDLIITTGRLDNDNASYMIRSLDRGATFTQISTSYNGQTVKPYSVESIGFGKAANGASYPAMRFAGRVNGDYGIYETLDNFATIQKIEAHPTDSPDGLTGIDGDPTTFGRWVYGIGQNGWAESVLA